jgi:hypothetical protein
VSVVGRPAKSLAAHIRDRTFRPARHAHLLGDVTEQIPPELERFRERYLGALSARERQAILLDFADAIEADELAGYSDESLEHILSSVQLAPGALERIELVKARGSSALDRLWCTLRSILDAPPVRCDLLDEQGAVDLYYRACRVRGLRRDGVPIALISKRLGISTSTVQRDLHKLETIWRDDVSLIDASNTETGWAWTLPED